MIEKSRGETISFKISKREKEVLFSHCSRMGFGHCTLLGIWASDLIRRLNNAEYLLKQINRDLKDFPDLYFQLKGDFAIAWVKELIYQQPESYRVLIEKELKTARERKHEN
jgi:hypothetical protein